MKRETAGVQNRMIERLMRLPLFYKILLANSAIVTLGAVGGTIITAWHVLSFPDDPHYELIALFAGAGLSISLAVNYWVLRVTLATLDRLQRAVDEVSRGNRQVRVESMPLDDERFERLTATFNQMLAQLEENELQLHHLSQQILEAQEDERRRVARELHDEAAQALTSLLLRLRMLERSENPEEARQHVQELRRLTAQALEDVRRVALELRPTILDDLGLTAALAWRVDELNAGNLVKAELQVQGVNQRLPKPIELTFYRIGQEALTNIARHSKARQATVLLKRAGDELVLQVQDDGVGFDPRLVQAEQHHGLGLLGIRERLALLGGNLLIESHPGQGTRLRACAPLPKPAEERHDVENPIAAGR